MFRTAITHRNDVQSDKSVVPGLPSSAFVMAGAEQGRVRNNALSILDEGFPESVPTTKAESMCKRNPYSNLRKRNRFVNLRMDCRCWGCDECRPKQRRKWIANATRRIENCTTYLAWTECDPDHWDAFRRQLRRYGCDDFRVRFESGRFGVLFSTPVPPVMLPFTSRHLTKRDAIQKVTGWITSINSARGGNPVSSSRAWSLPARDLSDWDVVAIGPSPACVKALAAKLNLLCSERTIHGAEMVTCYGDTAAIDALCEGLMTKNSASEEYTDWDTAPYELASWRGFPDEEPDPYLVGAVT
jgi:hypothetical protein